MRLFVLEYIFHLLAYFMLMSASTIMIKLGRICAIFESIHRQHMLHIVAHQSTSKHIKAHYHPCHLNLHYSAHRFTGDDEVMFKNVAKVRGGSGHLHILLFLLQRPSTNINYRRISQETARDVYYYLFTADSEISHQVEIYNVTMKCTVSGKEFYIAAVMLYV